jgi:hypothetical protein
MNISKKQQLVLTVIKANQGCQNNDADLIAAVWKREGFENMYINNGLEYALNHVTRSETITRRRRELYNMGLIEYSEKALDSRTEAFKSELDNHSDVRWIHD